MNILYITRKFPPSIGGMQTQSRQFYDSIAAGNKVYLIAWGHSQLFLPLFMAYAFMVSVLLVITNKVDVIQLGDLVLSPLGFLLKILFNKPVLSVSHGRDSAYAGILYDLLVLCPAKKLDRIICVSNYIKERLAARGIPENKLAVIPNGIDIKGRINNCLDKDIARRAIAAHFGIMLTDKKIILSVSRLVPKKGIKEFIEEGMPRINEKNKDILFLVAGDGPQAPEIDNAIRRSGFFGKAHRLGYVEHDSGLYNALFTASDVFVMPNIKVKDDAEGFGLVVLEAGMNALPVVAYEVDGIAEALHNNKNGILIKEGDYNAFAETVSSLLSRPDLRLDLAKKSREYVMYNFSWDRIAGDYLAQYAQLMEKR
ncbi:MAG: glycosyltransferase family 4 protein [Candidatus Omnitrophota bacterium]|nr:glycosyltransferase family 4 protein [Candidatus Omnitrophota bacterium]